MNLERIAQRFKSINLLGYTESFRPQMESLAVEMLNQSCYRGLSLNIDKTMLHMQSCGEGSDHFFRLAHRNGELLGCVYGYAFKTFFSDEVIAQVKGIWVTQSHKGSAAFVLMLASFEEWARGVGARLVFLDQTTALDIERTMNLFEGCGYRVIGVNTLKEL